MLTCVERMRRTDFTSPLIISPQLWVSNLPLTRMGVSHHVREQSLIPGEGDGGGGRKEGPQKICELVREGLVKKIGTERRAIKK